MITIFNRVLFETNHMIIIRFLTLTFLQIFSIPIDKVIYKKESFQNQKFLTGKESIVYTIFFVIVINNLIRLLPGIHRFTVTILFNTRCAFIILIIIWIHIFSYDINKFFRDINVLTTSKIFRLFLALIELIRFFIRPVTLAIRIRANIITGHLIFSLVIFLSEPSLLFLRMFFTLFETFVSFIQAYIFITLIKLYRE